MEYKEEQLPSYNLHVIKTNKFKNIAVSIYFRRPITKNEQTIRSVLVNTLLENSKKYKTSREIEIETEELYGSYINIFTINSGKCSVLGATTTFLNEKYTEKGQFNRAIDLLSELLLNPNVTNNKFNQKSFLIAKDIVKNAIKSKKDNPPRYAVDCLLKEINSKSPISFTANIRDLNKINETNLYEYYLDVINNDTIDIFIVGDLTNKMINDLKKKFVFKKRKHQELDHSLIEHNICKNLISKESLPVKQSTICLGYVFDELTEFESRYVMKILNYILGGSSDSLLFKTVREKESLCYGINSSYSLLNRLLFITSGIDKTNFNKTKKLILQEVENLKNGKFTIEDIKKGQTCYENSCINMQDSIGDITNLYRSIYFIKADTPEERIKQIKKVKKADVIKLANKMHLSKIFFLEGSIK